MGAGSQRWSRRGLIGLPLAGLAVAALTGCRYTDSVIHSDRHNTGVSATPDPTPDAEHVAAATAELALAGDLAWFATGAGVTAPVKTWAASVTSAHQAAAHVLNQVDVMGVPASAPEPVKPTPHATAAEALAAVKTKSAALVTAHRARALAASDPAMALLWASLMVTAQAEAAPTVAMVSRATRPHHVDAGTADEAQVVLLERLHAAIQGYETGIAALDAKHPYQAPAVARLGVLTRERDTRAAQLRRDGGDPPGPRAGYQQPLRPTNAAQAAQLFVLIERGLLDALGRLVAASTGPAREAALTSMAAQVGPSKAFGGAMVVWPGWP